MSWDPRWDEEKSSRTLVAFYLCLTSMVHFNQQKVNLLADSCKCKDWVAYCRQGLHFIISNRTVAKFAHLFITAELICELTAGQAGTEFDGNKSLQRRVDGMEAVGWVRMEVKLD